jgi:hypothetical protein
MSASSGPSIAEHHYHQALGHDHARRTIRTIPELKREPSRETLAAVGLLDALDIDDRPSFAIQTQPAPPYDESVSLELVYYNRALANTDGLLARVTGQPDARSVFYEHDQTQHAFRTWLSGVGDEHDFARRGSAYIFDGLIWTAITVEGHKIVSGLHASLLWPEVSPSKHHENHVQSKYMPVQGRAPALPPNPLPQIIPSEDIPPSSGTKYGPFDVTLREPPESVLSEHVKHFRTVDWANTPLGVMPDWPPELRTAVNMCLNDIHPCMLFWGDDVIMIYNAAYVQLIGAMHPYAMGRSAREVASDYWPTFQPLVDRINITGQSICDIEVPIFIDRLGFLEETYWTFQFIPVLDNQGLIAGYYHPLFETTK